MKTNFLILTATLFLALNSACPVGAATTINPTNKSAYAANLGWIDWRGDTTNGAVIGEYVCAGYICSANVGWISLGSGSPANQIQYQNASAADFGVNHDGLGNLRGYAYGANIGWINFESTGAPKVDLKTGGLSGYVYSANCGWISLSNAFAQVKTDTIPRGPLAPNGLPIAWLLQNFGTTNGNVNLDSDGDGVSDANEYLAGTNPNDINDVLKITSYLRGTPSPTYNSLVWTSKPSRCYAVQSTTDLTTSFSDYLSLPILGWNNVGFDSFETDRFYRIRAFRPLTP